MTDKPVNKDKILNEEFTLEGIKVYDPRDRTFKISNNPALILADLVIMSVVKHDVIGIKIDKDFWHIIGELADWAE